MALKIFSLLSIFLCSFCVSCRDVPVFPRAYSVTGTQHFPYGQLTEPFEAWFDADDMRSRIDYYQGMVKTISSKLLYVEIVPVTTETQSNVPTCFKSLEFSLQSTIPDLTNFSYVGSEIKNGYQCDVWRDEVRMFDTISTYTMWIRWQKDPKSPSLSQPIPVRFELKGSDLIYFNYDNFVLEKPSPDVFTIPPNIKCESNNANHDHHVYHFNPMLELINRDTAHVDEAWEKYKTEYPKSYDGKEHQTRKDIFKQNLRYIHSMNRQGLGFTLKVNHLADRTDDEIRAIRGRQYNPGYNGGLKFPYSSDDINKKSTTLPQDFDWRIRGAVTTVKDQAWCGSCWSFGSSGSIEGAYFLKTGKLVSLSQQALMDCSWGFGNRGCNGGVDTQAYQWIMKHGGIPSDEDYSYYLGQDGYCHIDTVNLLANIKSYVNVTSGDENALRLAIYNHGPISVAIDASPKSFMFYSNGVYYESKCRNEYASLDHSVLAIGYGSLNGQNYWLIKNSWSNHWGDQGYILMSSKDNNCGVETVPTYVNLA